MATNEASPAAPPAAEGGGDGADGGALLSLNVRMIDQRTFPISIRSGASVPQLKAVVEVETGVTLARQRLIFRGRVLKNDQKIAAYSLEDGHTLHLVVRADPPPPAPTVTTPAVATAVRPGTRRPSSTRTAGTRRVAFTGEPPRPTARDNDEPDPQLAGQPPNRVLMGATITVPEGSDVNMPFLSSMIANIMTSVQDQVTGGGPLDGADAAHGGDPALGVGGGGAGDHVMGLHRVAFQNLRGGSRHRSRSSGRSRRDRPADVAAAADPLAAAATAGERARAAASDRQATLRGRVTQRLDTIHSTLSNAELDFQGVTNQNIDPATNSDAAAFQAQLNQFDTLMAQFRTRLQLLPAALTAIEGPDRPQDATEAQTTAIRAVVRSIETLQTIGESADLLSRIARHLVIRQSARSVAEFSRGEDRRGHRYWRTATRTFWAPGGPATDDGQGAGATGGAAADDGQSTSAADGENRAETGSAEAAQTQSMAGQSLPARGMMPPFLERLFAGSRSFPVDLTGGAAVAGSVPVSSANVASGPGHSQGANRVSISGIGLPMASVVFPISLAGVNNSVTTWNFAEFLNRLIGELPSSALYGVLTGDPLSVHQIMAHVGFALVSGVDLPPVSRPAIRTWSTNLVNELRQQLRDHGLPAAILADIESSRRAAFVDELIRPFEPFMPELVDLLFRAMSASRAAAFGTSSAEFMGTMAAQFVNQFQVYLGGDLARVSSVLRQLLVYLGLRENLAMFAVDSFLLWVERHNTPGPTTRRRQRAATTEAASGPAAKRQRRP